MFGWCWTPPNGLFCFILGLTSPSLNEEDWLAGGLNSKQEGGPQFLSPTPFYDSLKNSDNVGEIVAKCDVCGKSFRSLRGFELHRKMHMYAEGCMNGPQCRICTKHFQTMAHLRRHMKSHSSEKPHVCNVCTRAYKHRKDLAQHSKHCHNQ